MVAAGLWMRGTLLPEPRLLPSPLVAPEGPGRIPRKKVDFELLLYQNQKVILITGQTPSEKE